MDYSLVENLKWLRENKTAFLEQLNKILPEDSGLTVEDSWDTIDAFIASLQTDYINLDGGAEEPMERFLSDSIETAISVSSTTINPYTFYKKTSLKKVKADNATSIEKYAFYNCAGLTEISAENVTTIGSNTFEGCTALAHASMPALTYLSSYAFHNTAFTNLDWLDMPKITYIGSGAFNGCTKLSGDLLLNCPATIDSQAFAYCKNLERIIVTTDATEVNTSLVYTGTTSANRPDGYALKYIACEQASKPSTWSSTWNRVGGSDSYYQWPTYWNASIKDWVFVYNSEKEDSYWTGRVLEEFPDAGEKEGCTFEGWYWDKDFTNAAIVPCTTTETIPMLYARWLSTVNVEVLDDEDETWCSFKNITVTLTVSAIITELVQTYKHQVTTLYADKDFTTEITDDSQFSPGCTIYCSGTAITQSEFDYTGAEQCIVLRAGTYKLECWGAQGGPSTRYSTIGKGGYSVGVLTLNSKHIIYVNVGGQGSCGTTSSGWQIISGGFNGGGGLRTYNRAVSSGGGASDIRLDKSSLYTRLIVAGGGGGTGQGAGVNGHGGGTTGVGNSVAASTGVVRTGYDDRTSIAASQLFGGDCHVYQNYGQEATYSTAGSFGLGSFYYSDHRANTSAGGGGGGWYGGGTSNHTAGAGGSGWVYTEATYTYWADNSVEGKTGLWSIAADYYLSDASTLAGSQSFLSPKGVTETGHSGNGYVRITKLS